MLKILKKATKNSELEYVTSKQEARKNTYIHTSINQAESKNTGSTAALKDLII